MTGAEKIRMFLAEHCSAEEIMAYVGGSWPEIAQTEREMAEQEAAAAEKMASDYGLRRP